MRIDYDTSTGKKRLTTTGELANCDLDSCGLCSGATGDGDMQVVIAGVENLASEICPDCDLANGTFTLAKGVGCEWLYTGATFCGGTFSIAMSLHYFAPFTGANVLIYIGARPDGTRRYQYWSVGLLFSGYPGDCSAFSSLSGALVSNSTLCSAATSVTLTSL